MNKKIGKIIRMAGYVLIFYAILTSITVLIFFQIGEYTGGNPLQNKAWLGDLAEWCFLVNLPSGFIFDGSWLMGVVRDTFGHSNVFVFLLPSFIYGSVGYGLYIASKFIQNKNS